MNGTAYDTALTPDHVPRRTLTPLPAGATVRASGPPREFDCFCVFCTSAGHEDAAPPRRRP
ncbi:hypothetical protein [Streptomyces wuyuanensis]|uniref:hypothetical protein n=1 Tax=Streptomyces wuyuanensis TaxID=1196353 RepID=UPI0034204BEE